MELVELPEKCRNNPLMLEVIRPEKGRQNPNFPLSTRIRNCLKSEGIVYVGQLLTMTEEQLNKISRLGPDSVNEIKDLLAKKELPLGIPCPKPLRTPKDIIKFYCIDASNVPPELEATQQAALNKPFSKIFVRVSLPFALVKGKEDAQILSSIREVCQNAFEKAVKQKVIDELSEVENYKTPPLQKTNSLSDESLPKGSLRNIIVPLYLPTSLTVTFKDSLIQDVTRDLGGLRLYNDLKPLLDTQPTSKPV